MTVKLEGGKLIITVDANTTNPPMSSSMKSLLVVSETEKQAATVQGKPLKVQVNAYIPAR